MSESKILSFSTNYFPHEKVPGTALILHNKRIINSIRVIFRRSSNINKFTLFTDKFFFFETRESQTQL